MDLGKNIEGALPVSANDSVVSFLILLDRKRVRLSMASSHDGFLVCSL